jgi:hypothetical protein
MESSIKQYCGLIVSSNNRLNEVSLCLDIDLSAPTWMVVGLISLERLSAVPRRTLSASLTFGAYPKLHRTA